MLWSAAPTNMLAGTLEGRWLMSHDLVISIVDGADPTIKLVGELEIASAHELRAVLRDVVGDVTLDLAELTFLDSSGMSVLLGAHRRFEAEARTLRLVGMSPPVRRAVELAGLDNVLVVDHR
jgi:anti-sigma B factor antagonist